MEQVTTTKIKAYSKANRLRIKRKRGRPKLEGILREPNGRRSRAKRMREPADELTITMRAKHTGLTLAEAKDPRAESYIGRLYMLGVEKGGISEDQYNAAIRFLEIDNNYKKVLLSPSAHYDQRNMANDPEAYRQFCIEAKKRYKAAREAIQEAQFDNNDENLLNALQYVVVENLELPHLVGATRMVLNALSRHFFLAKTCH